jgi:pilus assembly protein FimV
MLGLGGVLWWMMAGGGRRRKVGSTALEDSIMSGSAGRPNTVIGESSGGSVNTNTGDTSFLTDFSQAGLGAIDTHDVDPIAEADVYMAYGRDAQAEEILKEAINKNPDRQEIRLKLLEIYAARRNAQAFESTAGELYAALGNATSPLWDKAREMGRGIDPTNPLYGGVQSAGAPVATVDATESVVGGAVKFDEETKTAEPLATSLDFEPMLPEAEPEIAAAPEPKPADEPMEFDAGAFLAFDSQPEAAPEARQEEVKAPEASQEENKGLDFDFDLSSLDFPEAEPKAAEPVVVKDEALSLDLGQAEAVSPANAFDFGALDLDLDDAGTEGSDELDEIGTKLDLARAYIEMGDAEGAHEILNEVLGEGNDKQKADAQGLLNSLG